jgi:hypothetical protein
MLTTAKPLRVLIVDDNRDGADIWSSESAVPHNAMPPPHEQCRSRNGSITWQHGSLRNRSDLSKHESWNTKAAAPSGAYRTP